MYAADDPAVARERNDAFVELNHLVTSDYGIPGLKAAMRSRGAPAGVVRSPHTPVPEAVAEELAAAVERALD
ncbi:hypothetical protein [Halosegnis marinus]|uniref:hypothetical protein n=1 Tax=Halosegnis marinus TaxID=3034023 RepID=UPI00360BCD1D